MKLGLILILAATLCPADTVILKSGARYAGKFLSGDAVRVRFRTGRKIVRIFPTREVERIEIGAPAAAEPAKEPAIRARTPEPAPSSTTPPALAPAPASTPAAIAAPPPEPLTTPQIGGANSSAALNDMGAVDSEYTRMGSDNGVLGSPRAPSQPTRDGRAVVRFYSQGAIYWTSGGGARALYGPVLQAWMAAGGEQSRLGYPTSDQQDNDAGFVRRQAFEHGAIVWTEKDGAKVEY